MLFGGFNPDMLIAESEPDEPSEEPAPPQKTRGARGVAGRQCEQKIPALWNQKRCATCAKETWKLQKRATIVRTIKPIACGCARSFVNVATCNR